MNILRLVTLKFILLAVPVIYFLSGCVIAVKPDGKPVDREIEIITPKPKVITKTVTVTKNTGCAPMVMPKVSASPALPTTALSKVNANDNAGIDRILMNYIKNVRNVNNNNIAAMHRAVAAQRATCK